MKIDGKSTILGIVVGVLLGVLLIAFAGCQPSGPEIKITYGEWEYKTATVVEIDKEYIVIEVEGIRFTLKEEGELIGNKKGIEIRDVWKTRCENNSCELLDTNQEIRIVDDLVI